MKTARMIAVNIPADVIAEIVAQQVAQRVPVDRQRAMVERMGEACTRAVAAETIGASVKTVSRLIAAGTLRTACAGSRVDVRSLCEYIESAGGANQ